MKRFPKRRTLRNSSKAILAALLVLAGAGLNPAAAADEELTNYKSGIDVIWGGTKGVDYCEEYLFSDKIVDDHKIVYLRSTTPIEMRHNERNVAFLFYGPGKAKMVEIGANGKDGVPNSGDEGVIRYKLDRDRQYHFKWADSPSRSAPDLVLPAYSGPFKLQDLVYEKNVPVVGTVGRNDENVADRDKCYWRGLTDDFGDEWHVLSYADDDSGFQRLSETFIDQAWYASDGKTVLLVVNPKTPCLSPRATGSGQFYTTPAKAYWTPKIVPQTTYIAAGANGTVTLEIRDINGNNVFFRINGGNFINAGASSVTLDQDRFQEGSNTLEYYYEGNEKHTKTRIVVKNPPFPSAAEPHGNYLWEDPAGLAVVKSRIARSPYKERYEILRDRSDASGQDAWDANAMKGRRFNGSVINLTGGSASLGNAFVALMEGWEFKRPGAAKSPGEYAREMLLDHPRTIDPLGFEMWHTSDSIPSRELHYRGYYDASPVQSAIFAYDIMVANFRADQVPGGLTAIEDYFIRDRLAGFAYEAMQWSADMCAIGEPGMWGGARMMTGSLIAMIMPEYSTPYYGTSGFGKAQTTYPVCPFETDRLTWKKALFDCDAPKSDFPNYTWGLGMSDCDPGSYLLSENQAYGGQTWPLATWRNKGAYISTGLMGKHLMVWANMAKRYGDGKTDPRLEICFERCADGTFVGATNPEPPKRQTLLLLLNSRWPRIVEKTMPWLKLLPDSDNLSVSKQLQDTGVFGFAWYDDTVMDQPR